MKCLQEHPTELHVHHFHIHWPWIQPYLTAVSYTHLDVYKRQGRKSLEEVMAKLDSLGFKLNTDDE